MLRCATVISWSAARRPKLERPVAAAVGITMAAAISVTGRVPWPRLIISRAIGIVMLTAMTKDESTGSSTHGSA